jgi:hypothetical protein
MTVPDSCVIGDADAGVQGDCVFLRRASLRPNCIGRIEAAAAGDKKTAGGETTGCWRLTVGWGAGIRTPTT